MNQPNRTFEQFVALEEMRDSIAKLRYASQTLIAKKLERYLLDCPQRGETRMTLAGFDDAQMRETFVATVAGRGFNGKRRTVMLKDLRLFGCKFIYEDHLWVRYDKRWERIEPFFQGQKVVLVGTAAKYTRKDSTHDYTLTLEKVTKL